MADPPSLQEMLVKIASLEQELAESKSRYNTIFGQAAVGIVHCALNGRFLRVNANFTEFLGYSSEEITQRSIKDITFPEDITEDVRGINELISGKSLRFTREKRYLRKDAKVVWGHVTVSLLLDEAGKPTMLLGIIQDIDAKKVAEEALLDSLHQHKIIFENSPLGMIHFDSLGTILDCNDKFIALMGSTRQKLIGFNAVRQSSSMMQETIKKALAGEVAVYEDAYTSVTGGKTTSLRVVFNPVTPGQSPSEVIATLEDITSRKLAEEVIAHRLLSLTQPLTDTASITFEDLFNLSDIQIMQDQFAKATGVASIITSPNGAPITQPSNFTRLCSELIRPSEKGYINCCKSDAALGRLSTEGPIVQPCLSGGLWDAGAGIAVGGHHLANWLIGQVRDATQTEEKIRRYAREIGIDEEQVALAFQQVPAMSREHFEEIAAALFTLANRLSTTAYQNVQQARFISDLKGAQEQLQLNENRLRFALEGANDGFWDANLDTGEVFFSRRSLEILGFPLNSKRAGLADWKTLVHPDDFPRTWAIIKAHMQKETPIMRLEHRLRMQNGAYKYGLTRGKVVEWAKNGRALRMTGTLTDIDDRKKIEQTQMFLLTCDRSAAGEDFFKALARFLAEILGMDFVCIDRLEGDKLSARTVANFCDGIFVDNLTYTLLDTPCGQAVGETICCYPKEVRQLFPKDAVLQEMAAESYAGTTLWDSQGKAIGLIAVIGRRPLDNQSLAESVLKLAAIRAASELERREAEHEKVILQTQLMQAQKMESVGRLAGGVAHDFNNMLGVILGHVEMAEEQLNQTDPLLLDLLEIKKAATRSAGLTRQLLAFARKQTISPKVLDLNETVESLLKMLRRLIGEDIDLTWLPGAGLWPVKIDPTQVDQILANLTVNARDAIDGVGKIIIATANVVLDDDYCADNLGFLPGNYVLLTVRDDGCGIDEEIREHIFEPFFTTKEVGRGTGLGLATIYGIVKQNSGLINVYSEPGNGSTFRIFLPKHVGKVLTANPEQPAGVVQVGRETILLVEDEPSILRLGTRMLEQLGYHVLSAASPGEALQLAEEFTGNISLLLTDVIMPTMNGRDLAKRLLPLYPGMARMFMSGYTADVIAHHGVLDADVQFIQKPFSKTELSAKVREALQKKEQEK
jgi:two-component system, cell cycle sensor histidine kinase and response regulator CckA